MSNPVSMVKESHRQKAFDLLAKRGEISRVEIAKELNTSLQTSMKIMQFFTDYGLAKCIGEVRVGQVGRKPQIYAFNPDVAHIIAVVHEGSVVSVGVLNLACELLAEETAEIRSGIHNLLVKQPCEIAERLIKDLADKGTKINRLLGMGLCLPGVVDDIHNEISFAPSFAVNASYHIGNLLKEAGKRIGAPVCIENDVNAAVYGEFTRIGVQDMAFISIGSNVGMGLVLDGKLRRGPSFTAGEIGLVPYSEDTAPAQIRSVEDLIGLEALKRRFGFNRQFGVSQMAPEARKGMMTAVSDVVAHIIATCAAMLNVSDFVLGGLTMELLGDRLSSDELLEMMRDKVNELSPFKVTVHRQSFSSPALIGGARKVIDRQLGTLLDMDSTEAVQTE